MSHLTGRAFIVIEKGSSYCKRESLAIDEGRISIGRAWKNARPDLSFTSAYISRDHAELVCENELFFQTDHSKHGTAVNGVALPKGEPRRLRHGDTIGLAGNEAVLSFYLETCPEETLPLAPQAETKILLGRGETGGLYRRRAGRTYRQLIRFVLPTLSKQGPRSG